MTRETRETVYSSKSAAVRGMWRYYNANIRCNVGSPLVGDGGTVLQWCDNGRTSYMSVTHNDRDEIILIKGWITSHSTMRDAKNALELDQQLNA